MKIVAKVILYNNQGQILVLQRGNTHPHFPGHFDLPGGEIEAGELPAKAVARELQEETGLNVASESMTLLLEKQQDKYTKHLLFEGAVSTAKPSIALSWEHNDYFWLTPAEIQQHALPASVDLYYKNALGYLTKQLGQVKP